MSTFTELINGEDPVLVDFYADWCGPCQTLKPILEEASGMLKGRAKIIKVDVDKNPQAAQAYRIQSIPTMILFKKGQVLWKRSGVMDASSLVQEIEPHCN